MADVIERNYRSEIESGMIGVVAESLDLEPDEVPLNARLVQDLEADSLDVLDIGYRVGKRFGVKFPLTELRKHFEETGISFVNDDGCVTEEGLSEVTAALPEVRGRIQVGDRVDAVFKVLTVDDLVEMVTREVVATGSRLRRINE